MHSLSYLNSAMPTGLYLNITHASTCAVLPLGSCLGCPNMPTRLAGDCIYMQWPCLTVQHQYLGAATC